MKFFYLLPLSFFTLFVFDSCKKGCTDPYAENYNPNREIDNGSCNVYSHVLLNSVNIHTIPELNSIGYAWDAGFGTDLDDDNTYPDLFVSFKADNGYSLIPNTYWPTVDPNNVGVYQELDPVLSLSSWQQGGFWIYLSEIDFPFEEELIDSVFVDPFDYDAGYNRFKDTMMVIKGNIQLTANMNWVE